MKICIVAHNAYRMMSGEATGHIGGVELQSSMMARWFARAGHETYLITWIEGGSAAPEVIDGVTVVKTCRQNDGIRFVRFFYPRWVSLNRALKFADSDIYYQNGAEYVTGQVALWCRNNGKKFVFSAASDLDCQAGLPLLRSLREKVLYRYGLKHADRIIVQTRDQQKELESGFGYSSQVLPMPCDLEPISGTAEKEIRNVDWHAVFVGRLSSEKNIEMFIEVASIASYALVAFGRTAEDLEASFRYTVLGSLASTLILTGVVLVYAVTGTLDLGHVAVVDLELVHDRGHGDPPRG